MTTILSNNVKINNIIPSDECNFDEMVLYQCQKFFPKDKQKLEMKLETFLKLNKSNVFLNEKNKDLEILSDIEEREEREESEGLFLMNRNILFFLSNRIEEKTSDKSIIKALIIRASEIKKTKQNLEVKNIIINDDLLNKKNNIKDNVSKKNEINDVFNSEIKNTHKVDTENNTNSAQLSEKVEFVQQPQIEVKTVNKSPLEVPCWRILHTKQSTEKNDITYVFKKWGNEHHQIKILFFMKHQMQFIASTGRVYQTSLDNLNQYQGRAILSLENSSENEYDYITSIDADPKKKDGDL
ncbi:hypothetical protein LW139_18460 [Proteus vulgaris]|uniref:hypothetical protein n=1 Tax=Proteus TaxID=583 RepID=UPI0014136134|nr:MULTISPECIES: hypothetical protein [Proteus]NBM54718.1 hypothetical protein [Proteus sp. G2669]UPK80744.1 hypothetical protein LW139_18460 [Proteus vulgaris]